MESCDQQSEASGNKDDTEEKNTVININTDHDALVNKDKKGGFTLARHSLSSFSKRRPFSR